MPHRASDRTQARAHRGADEVSARLARALSHINAAIAELASLEPLTDDQRQHMVRGRPGATRYLLALAEMPAEFPELNSLEDVATGVSVDSDIADEADRVVIKCDRVRQIVADLALEHHAAAWTAGMDIYSAADSAERRNPGIATALAPVRGFLARGPYSTTTTTTEPAAPPAPSRPAT